MLISSMDQLNYYSMPKDGYLEIDTSSPNGYSMDQQSLDDDGSPTYMNEENSPKNGTKSSLYKTELCKRFSEFGSCRYGAKCQFAHGLAELRHVLRHPKYKTTKCKSYWGSGHCPYGSRCRFIHEETESMGQPPFSPQGGGGGGASMGAMNSMFFQEATNQQLSGLGGAELGVSPTGGGSYLYGGGNRGGVAPGASNDHHHVLTGGSYQKEYSMLSSFDNDASSSTPWGMAPARSPPHRGFGGASPPPPIVANGNGNGNGHAAGVARANGSAYPDLQDAIDTLMRFSIAPSDSDASPGSGASASAPLGTISSSPVESRSSTATAASTSMEATSSGAIATTTTTTLTTTTETIRTTKKKDYALDANELWNDFPSLSTTSSSEFAGKQWPAGLSLSLEGTGLFSNSSTSTATATGSTPTTTTATSAVDQQEGATTTTTAAATMAISPNNGKKDETSPRLSIFERFH